MSTQASKPATPRPRQRQRLDENDPTVSMTDLLRERNMDVSDLLDILDGWALAPEQRTVVDEISAAMRRRRRKPAAPAAREGHPAPPGAPSADTQAQEIAAALLTRVERTSSMSVRWNFGHGCEVSSSGGDSGKMWDGLFMEVGYLVDYLHRKAESRAADAQALTALREYAQHKTSCSLRKPRVYRNVPDGWQGDELDGGLAYRKEFVSGPGETCTCGLTARLEHTT